MSIQLDLKDKIAIVTGAGRGIGKAIALMLAAHGANVCVNDINPNAVRTTSGIITAQGGSVIPFHGSADNKMMVQTMFQEVIAAWERVDILVNSAGIEPEDSLLKQGEWEWMRTFEVNMKGTFLCTQIAGRVMKETGSGAIVNLGSSPGYPPHRTGYTAVSASKAAVAQFTRDAARELAAYNIRVNAICPGYIKTALTEDWQHTGDDIRWGEPEDVAAMALFLCSDAARFVSGQVICVDGGASV